MKIIDNVPRESRWSVFYLLAALAVLAALVAPPQAYAESGYVGTWSGIYPGSASDNNASCQLCHGNSTQDINPYGFAMAQCNPNGPGGNISARIQAVEGQDSDGQGDSNLTEINADTQPGWTTDAVQVRSRNNCNPQGTDTYSGAGDVDPVATNLPPVANANGPYTGTAGQQVTFDGSDSTDPDGTIVAYDWTFGDGNTGTSVNPVNTYAAAGTYDVSLTVTDDAGSTSVPSTTTATIAAAPQDPIADPNGPYTGVEGVAVTFDGSGSQDPDGGNITAYDWDFGDGNTGAGVAPGHTYAIAGTYTVTLTVVDDEGAQSAPAATTATIDLDQDADGIADNQDNCIEAPNGTLLPVGESAISQRDTDGDGFGNVCDTDLNNDLVTDLDDFSLLRAVMDTSDPDADFNGDGTVNVADFFIFRDLFGLPPGPSAQ